VILGSGERQPLTDADTPLPFERPAVALK